MSFSLLSCSSYKFLTTWALCNGELLSWKMPSPSENNAWTIGEHDHPKCSLNPCCWSYHAEIDGTEENSTICLPKPSLIHICALLWAEGSQGCKLPCTAFTHKLALQLGKEKKWTRRRISLNCFHLSTDQPLWSLHHFNLFWMLMVEIKGFLIAAFPWYPVLLSSRRTVLVETGLFKCWFNSSVTLAAVVRCFLPTMRVGNVESLAEITSVARGFSVLLEFHHGPWYDSSRKKTSGSAVLVTDAPAMRVPTICTFKTQLRNAFQL